MLDPRSVARPLDQNAAHRFRGGAEKVRAVLPGPVAVLHQPQPGLMHQCRRLKRLAGQLIGHSRARQPPQFSIHQRQQLFGCPFLATTDRVQNLRNLGSFSHGSHANRHALECKPKRRGVWGHKNCRSIDGWLTGRFFRVRCGDQYHG
jgi:hypothetical protein